MELIDQYVIDQGIVLSQEQKLKAVEKYHKRAIHGDIKEMDDETIFKVFCIGNRLVKDKKTNRNRREFLCISDYLT